MKRYLTKAQRKMLFVLSLVFCFLFAASCSKSKLKVEGAALAVNTAVAAEKYFPDTVSGFGSLSYMSKVDIAAPQNAVVKKIYFREGEAARKGRLIVELDNPQIELAVRRAEDVYRQSLAAVSLAEARLLEGGFSAEAEIVNLAKSEAELAEAKRQLAEEKRKHESSETLYAAGGMSDESIRESRFNIESAEEQIRLLELDLEMRRIGLRDADLAAAGYRPANDAERRAAQIALLTATLRAEAEAARAQLEAAGRERESAQLALAELSIPSPVSGIVGARYLEEGERVSQYDKIATVIEEGPLYAIFTLREADALRIKKGMKTVVACDGTGQTYEGVIDLVAPQADSQSLSFTVRAVIPADESLKPGMFARVEVSAGEARKRLVIPDAAIAADGDGRGTVFAVVAGKTVERKIAFGELSGNGEREIISGLSPGDIVVLNPNSSIKEGTNVAVKK